MASFDVTSLCSNISIIDMLNVTKDSVKNDDQSTGKMALPQYNFFLDLANIISTTTWHTFIFQFCHKIVGVAMFKNKINIINKSFQTFLRM